MTEEVSAMIEKKLLALYLAIVVVGCLSTLCLPALMAWLVRTETGLDTTPLAHALNTIFLTFNTALVSIATAVMLWYRHMNRKSDSHRNEARP